MSKFYTLLISFVLFQSVQADIKDLTLNEISEKTSKFVSGIIPGEGLTEVDVRLRDDNSGNGNYEFKILGVRDILPSDNSNLFHEKIISSLVKFNTKDADNVILGGF